MRSATTRAHVLEITADHIVVRAAGVLIQHRLRHLAAQGAVAGHDVELCPDRARVGVVSQSVEVATTLVVATSTDRDGSR